MDDCICSTQIAMCFDCALHDASWLPYDLIPWRPQKKVSVAKYTPAQRKKRRRALQPVTVPRDAAVISR